MGRKAKEIFKWRSFLKENNIAGSQRMTRSNVWHRFLQVTVCIHFLISPEICSAVSVFKPVFNVVQSDVSFQILKGSHQWQELLLSH